MRKELDYFSIDAAYGGIQDWFPDPMMRLGGCAIVTACDSSIYFCQRKGAEHICPTDPVPLTKQDYIGFAKKMKPYLHPRWKGINKLEIYIDGFGQYLRDVGETRLHMRPLQGNCPVQEAEQALCEQIDKGLPVPCLLLHHRDKSFEDYDWHWFLLTGYECLEDTMMVKAVTYGAWRWLDFEQLWRTGYREKGGLILYDWEETA
ncbi:MAG: hypothetical protein Q4F79_06715 [Eubacteriales bacterium]|nr:hypothetical protein [Eubacteriales bacterium]